MNFNPKDEETSYLISVRINEIRCQLYIFTVHYSCWTSPKSIECATFRFLLQIIWKKKNQLIAEVHPRIMLCASTEQQKIITIK